MCSFHKELLARGVQVGKDRVQELMHLKGISGCMAALVQPNATALDAAYVSPMWFEQDWFAAQVKQANS